METKFFSIYQAGSKDYKISRGTPVKVELMKIFKTSSPEDPYVIGLPSNLFMKQDKNGNIKLPKGLWKFEVGANVKFTEALGSTHDHFTLYENNLAVYVNEEKMNDKVDFISAGSREQALQPIVFYQALLEDENLFRMELSPKIKLPNSNMILDDLLFRYTNITISGQKIADYPATKFLFSVFT